MYHYGYTVTFVLMEVRMSYYTTLIFQRYNFLTVYSILKNHQILRLKLRLILNAGRVFIVIHLDAWGIFSTCLLLVLNNLFCVAVPLNLPKTKLLMSLRYSLLTYVLFHSRSYHFTASQNCTGIFLSKLHFICVKKARNITQHCITS